MSGFFGRLEDPAYTRAVHAELGVLPLSQMAPRLVASTGTGDVLLYRAWKDVLGAFPDYVAQETGDCTSMGSGRGHDLLQCVEAEAEGLEYAETCTEAIYGAGREIAGMTGRGDGSNGCYGAAVTKAMITVGMVRRKDVGPYSGDRAKLWGRRGIPDDVRKLAGNVKLGAASLVTTVEEVDAALENGYPVVICSNCGFEGNGGFRRDSRGICRAGGSWPHCMVIVGRIDSDGVPTFVVAQSWGPTMPSGPTVLDMPVFTFRAHRSDIARYVLPAGDSFAISATPGFSKRALPSKWTYSGFA